MSATTDWISAIASVGSTVGTVGAVVTSLWLATREGREIRRRQAEEVGAWLVHYDGEQDDPHKVYEGLRVANSSNQIIYDLIAQIVSVQGSGRWTAVGDTEDRNSEWCAMVGNVPPGALTTRIATPGYGMHKRFGVEIAFQDAGGRYWLRASNGVLKRVDKHPIDLFGLSRPMTAWQNP